MEEYSRKKLYWKLLSEKSSRSSVLRCRFNYKPNKESDRESTVNSLSLSISQHCLKRRAVTVAWMTSGRFYWVFFSLCQVWQELLEGVSFDYLFCDLGFDSLTVVLSVWIKMSAFYHSELNWEDIKQCGRIVPHRQSLRQVYCREAPDSSSAIGLWTMKLIHRSFDKGGDG